MTVEWLMYSILIFVPWNCRYATETGNSEETKKYGRSGPWIFFYMCYFSKLRAPNRVADTAKGKKI